MTVPLLSPFLGYTARCLVAGVFIASVTCASGCGSSTPPEPKPEPPAKELSALSSSAVTTPQESLFETAKDYFANGLYTLAEESLASLRDSYPQGPYLEFAELKLADIAFLSRNYAEATQRYQQFVASHPTSHGTPYALYRVARSSQLSTGGVGRDITPVHRAVEKYRELIGRFPTSPYAKVAEEALLQAQELIVAHERYVQRFYERREQSAAAEGRQKSYAKERRVYVQQARKLQQQESQQQRSQTLPRPKLVFATRSKEKKLDQAPADSVRAMLTDFQIESPLLGDATSLTPDTRAIERVTCRTEGRKKLVFLYLSERLQNASFLKEKQIIRPQQGVLSVQIPQTVSEPRTIDCFSQGDLLISSHGLITVRGLRAAELLELHYPPRLLLASNT